MKFRKRRKKPVWIEVGYGYVIEQTHETPPRFAVSLFRNPVDEASSLRRAMILAEQHRKLPK